MCHSTPHASGHKSFCELFVGTIYVIDFTRKNYSELQDVFSTATLEYPSKGYSYSGCTRFALFRGVFKGITDGTAVVPPPRLRRTIKNKVISTFNRFILGIPTKFQVINVKYEIMKP